MIFRWKITNTTQVSNTRFPSNHNKRSVLTAFLQWGTFAEKFEAMLFIARRIFYTRYSSPLFTQLISSHHSAKKQVETAPACILDLDFFQFRYFGN